MSEFEKTAEPWRRTVTTTMFQEDFRKTTEP